MDRPKTGFCGDFGDYTYDMQISSNLMLHISVWSIYLTHGFKLRVFSWFISISCTYKHYIELLYYFLDLCSFVRGDGEMGNDEIVEDLGPVVQFFSQLS